LPHAGMQRAPEPFSRHAPALRRFHAVFCILPVLFVLFQ